MQLDIRLSDNSKFLIYVGIKVHGMCSEKGVHRNYNADFELSKLRNKK